MPEAGCTYATASSSPLGRPGLDAYGEAWAAVLATNGRGVLGDRSATAAIGLNDWPRRPELLILGGELKLEGVRIRRTRSLTEEEVTTDHNGLPCSIWPRAVTDLAATSSIAELQAVLDALDRNKLLDLTALESIPEADYRSLLERFSAMLLRAAALPSHELGFRVLRFTWQDVRYHPRRVVSDIRALL